LASSTVRTTAEDTHKRATVLVIFARQGSDGSWRWADAPLWLPTLFTLLLLPATGVDRAKPAVESAVARLEAGLRWNALPATSLIVAAAGNRREHVLRG
jgi:hypothetical protein